MASSVHTALDSALDPTHSNPALCQMISKDIMEDWLQHRLKSNTVTMSKHTQQTMLTADDQSGFPWGMVVFLFIATMQSLLLLAYRPFAKRFDHDLAYPHPSTSVIHRVPPNTLKTLTHCRFGANQEHRLNYSSSRSTFRSSRGTPRLPRVCVCVFLGRHCGPVYAFRPPLPSILHSLVCATPTPRYTLSHTPPPTGRGTCCAYFSAWLPAFHSTQSWQLTTSAALSHSSGCSTSCSACGTST